MSGNRSEYYAAYRRRKAEKLQELRDVLGQIEAVALEEDNAQLLKLVVQAQRLT